MTIFSSARHEKFVSKKIWAELAFFEAMPSTPPRPSTQQANRSKTRVFTPCKRASSTRSCGPTPMLRSTSFTLNISTTNTAPQVGMLLNRFEMPDSEIVSMSASEPQRYDNDDNEVYPLLLVGESVEGSPRAAMRGGSMAIGAALGVATSTVLDMVDHTVDCKRARGVPKRKVVLLHPRVMAWPGWRTGRGAGIAAWQSAKRVEGSGGSSRVEIGRLLTATIASKASAS